MDTKKLFAKFIKDERGIMQLIFLGVALLIIFVVIQILPVVNSSIAQTVVIPASGAGSEWNSSVNTALVNASEMWESVGGIFKVTLIVAIIAVLLAYLFSVVPRGNTPGQGGAL